MILFLPKRTLEKTANVSKELKDDHKMKNKFICLTPLKITIQRR